MAQVGDRWVSTDGRIELRCGDYREQLADVAQVDAVIVDAPYSKRTHDGSDAVATSADSADSADRRSLDYTPWGVEDVDRFLSMWVGRCRSWLCALTDDELFRVWRLLSENAGRYAFAPVPVLQHKPRLGGDGPGSGAVYLAVSRPTEKRFAKWGSLPCWYNSRPEKKEVMGAKPLALMRAIVRDYSRAGDLICDPCAGGGTTLLAAAMEGRRAIGSELDPATFALAVDRLRGWGPGISAEKPQMNLLAGLVR